MNVEFVKKCLLLSVLVLVSNCAMAGKHCFRFHVIDSAPLGYLDKDRQPAGVHAEILTSIAKYAGVCMRIEVMPYPRIWKSIEEGNHDGGIVFLSPSRKHLVQLVGMIRRVNTVVVPSKDFTITKYEDLYNLTIGTMRGSHLANRFDGDSQLILVKVNGYEQAAKMLDFGRITGIAGSEDVIGYYVSKLENNKQGAYMENAFKLGHREQWLQLSNHVLGTKKEKRIEALRRGIKLIHEKGDLKKIIKAYYQRDLEKDDTAERQNESK